MAVLVCTQMQFLREMLVQTLVNEAGAISLSADQADTACGAAPLKPPELMVVDARHPDAFTKVSDVRARFPMVAVVVLAATDQQDEFLAWASIGISGYVEPDTSSSQLVTVLRRAAAGEVVCPPRLTAVLLKHKANAANAQPAIGGIFELTRREREVMEQMVEGLCNKRIARQLRIAESTVKNHVHSILEKWDVRSRGEAAALYRRSTSERAGLRRNGPAYPGGYSAPRPNSNAATSQDLGLTR